MKKITVKFIKPIIGTDIFINEKNEAYKDKTLICTDCVKWFSFYSAVVVIDKSGCVWWITKSEHFMETRVEPDKIIGNVTIPPALITKDYYLVRFNGTWIKFNTGNNPISDILEFINKSDITDDKKFHSTLNLYRNVLSSITSGNLSDIVVAQDDTIWAFKKICL